MFVNRDSLADVLRIELIVVLFCDMSTLDIKLKILSLLTDAIEVCHFSCFSLAIYNLDNILRMKPVN